MYLGLRWTYLLFLLHFKQNRPVGVELFHADRQTDRRRDILKLRVAFLSFTNAPTTCGHTYMPQEWFETAIPVSEISKISLTLDWACTVISIPEAKSLIFSNKFTDIEKFCVYKRGTYKGSDLFAIDHRVTATYLLYTDCCQLSYRILTTSTANSTSLRWDVPGVIKSFITVN